MKIKESVLSLLTVIAAAQAYPSNMIDTKKRMPLNRNEKFMSFESPGEYVPAMLANENEISCDKGGSTLLEETLRLRA